MSHSCCAAASANLLLRTEHLNNDSMAGSYVDRASLGRASNLAMAYLDLPSHGFRLLLHFRQFPVPEHLLCSTEGMEHLPVHDAQYLQSLLHIGRKLHNNKQSLADANWCNCWLCTANLNMAA